MFYIYIYNSTQLDVELSTREQLSPINERSDPVDLVCSLWRHKQKHDWLASRWLAVRCSTGSVEFSWVELCRYKRALSTHRASRQTGQPDQHVGLHLGTGLGRGKVSGDRT